MKNLLLTTLILVFASASLLASTYFVKPNATGDGTSWEQASGDLATIMLLAENGDQIFVAKGVYKPTTSDDRTKSFVLKDGVQLYGGFLGQETALEQRNWRQNLTVLSGEIGEVGIQDNAYNVIYTKNVSALTRLDGFIITAGNANGKVTEGGRSRCGGGWYNDGSEGGQSTPTIRNCIFRKNHGNDGAAFYSNGRAGDSSPSFKNCAFSENQASLDGGAIYNDGRLEGKSNPKLVDCVFSDNLASYGGGIFAETGTGLCELSLTNCMFRENTAFIWGGGIYTRSSEGELDMQMDECKFDNNYPTDINKTYYLSKNND